MISASCWLSPAARPRMPHLLRYLPVGLKPRPLLCLQQALLWCKKASRLSLEPAVMILLYHWCIVTTSAEAQLHSSPQPTAGGGGGEGGEGGEGGHKKRKIGRTRSHDPQVGYGALQQFIAKKSSNKQSWRTRHSHGIYHYAILQHSHGWWYPTMLNYIFFSG